MKDYYSILEINESASTETVEKVHKLLIKKYHPDLQQEQDKAKAEEKMKEINEAYEVLTNPEKKKMYDAQLKEYRMQEIIKEMKKNGELNTEYNDNNVQVNQVETYNPDINGQTVSDEEIRRQAQVYYDEVYRQYLYRNGYIKDYKAIFKDYLARIITLIIIIGMIYLLFKIPYTRNIIRDLINSNEITKAFFGHFFE